MKQFMENNESQILSLPRRIICMPDNRSATFINTLTTKISIYTELLMSVFEKELKWALLPLQILTNYVFVGLVSSEYSFWNITMYLEWTCCNYILRSLEIR